MDTNKIREVQALIDEARHRGHNIPQLVEAARLLQAELDAAPKVFTDEEIERVASMCCPGETSQIMQASVPNGPIPLSQGENIRRHIVMALRYARDNGYLATAAGLTVEEVERANNVKDQCIATAWDGLSGKILVDDGTGTMRELLCDAHDVIRLLLNKR